MGKTGALPQQALDEINAWLPAVTPLWKRLVERSNHGFFLPEAAQHLHLAAVCLHDLADTIQTASRALYWAKHEWLRLAVFRQEPGVEWAIHDSRYHYDYAAVALSAASSHLASAMWHLEERIDHPLGFQYKTAAGARKEWKRISPGSSPPSLMILDRLLEDEAWKTVSRYRNQWVHRGLPVIAGEFRQTRRQIWQAADDPPPKTPWIMKRETENGRVSYWVQYDEPEFRMPELLDKGAQALSCLIATVELFLPLFDAEYAPHGVSFSDDHDEPQEGG